MRWTACFRQQSIMPGQPIEAELQHDFGSPRRPPALALDIFQSFEETTQVEQQPGKLRADSFHGAPHALACRNDRFGECRRRIGAAPVESDCGASIGGRSWHQLRPVEVAAQAIAGLQLNRLDQRTTVAPFSPGEPGERTLGLVYRQARAGFPCRQMSPRQGQVLAEIRIDRRA